MIAFFLYILPTVMILGLVAGTLLGFISFVMRVTGILADRDWLADASTPPMLVGLVLIFIGLASLFVELAFYFITLVLST